MTYTVSTQTGDSHVRRQRMDAHVTCHLHDLFDRLPALAGFRLRSDLMVADVSVVSCSGCVSIRRLHVSVMRALVELAECDPEAIGLMRGRTFARCPH